MAMLNVLKIITVLLGPNKKDVYKSVYATHNNQVKKGSQRPPVTPVISEREVMAQVYTSKIDTWLVLVLLTAVIACLVAFGLSFRTGSVVNVVATLPAILIGAGLPIWLMVSTRYILDDSILLVKSGPFKWQVEVEQITSITPTSNPFSSPALSLDRLLIEYGRGKSIMISPKDKGQFILDLEARRGNYR